MTDPVADRLDDTPLEACRAFVIALDDLGAAESDADTPAEVAPLLRQRADETDSFSAALRKASSVDPVLEEILGDFERTSFLYRHVADRLEMLDRLEDSEPGLDVAIEAARSGFVDAAARVEAAIGIDCFPSVEPAEELPGPVEAACRQLEAKSDAIGFETVDDLVRWFEALPGLVETWAESVASYPPSPYDQARWEAVLDDVVANTHDMSRAAVAAADGLEPNAPSEVYFEQELPPELDPEVARSEADEHIGFYCSYPEAE